MPAQLDSRRRVMRSIDRLDIDRVPTMFRAEPELIARLQPYCATDDLDTLFGSDLAFVTTGLSAKQLPDMTAMRDADDVDRVAWPDRTAIDIPAALRRIAQARATQRAVCAGAWASIFTHSRRIMGEERYLLEIYENPQLIQRVVDRLTDTFIDINQALFSQAAGLIDIFYFGSDFGTQTSLFLSPDLYRAVFKEPMRRLVRHAKTFGLKVMFHSCGAVAPLIPDFIDIEIDILDPVQVSARGMDLPALAAAFKTRIAFHGGISSQKTLPFAAPEEVRDEVRRAIQTLGPLGYICAPDQNMMEDTPPQNVIAMYDAIRAFGAMP